MTQPDNEPQVNLLRFLLILAACIGTSILAAWLVGPPWFGG